MAGSWQVARRERMMAKWDVVLAGYKGDEHYRFLVVVGEGEKYALSTRLFGDESNLSG